MEFLPEIVKMLRTTIQRRYIKNLSLDTYNPDMFIYRLYSHIVNSYIKISTKIEKGGDFANNSLLRNVTNLQIITNHLIWRKA